MTAYTCYRRRGVANFPSNRVIVESKEKNARQLCDTNCILIVDQTVSTPIVSVCKNSRGTNGAEA